MTDARTDALTDEEQQLWHAWKIASERVREHVVRDIRSATGLSDPDFGILTRLVDLGSGRLRQNELAASMDWHRSRLSHQLTRMEQRGLVRRTDADGGVLVAVTDEGRRLADAARPVHAAAVRRHLVEPTGPLDAAALLGVLRALADDRPR